MEDSAHEFYSCGEDAVVFHIDVREPKANKLVNGAMLYSDNCLNRIPCCKIYPMRCCVFCRLCVTKEGNDKVALYSIHANPFKSHEFCTGGRDQYIRSVNLSVVK